MDNYISNGAEIAIIGLSGRFPGAKNIDEFWQNLQAGVESITFFSDEELLAAGIDADKVNHPHFVKARGVLEGAELFDADFFGFNPRDAEITDPQHRIFLECAWEALENAGYNPENYPGSMGVYAGTGQSGYVLNVYSHDHIAAVLDTRQILIAADKDHLTTRVAYKLNLRGPSLTVQTACSTSLVAVHLACQSLLNGEADMALAGGVAISSTRKQGYFYKEGGIGSPDGHCRAFDAEALGTVGGEGVGIVVLKRLEEAIADQDYIHAIIKGSAINNDGSLKVSYTAPRIDSQAQVIKTAQLVAEVAPETITYIEAHGTGTSLGDPIEIAALTQAFRASTQKTGFCAIGSLKTNIGHLDAAAGVAGLIKTVLALKHKQIPPSLHFQRPNPQLNLPDSPFYVNNQLTNWETKQPRRAGVSSFGVGGTNAHVILEEAPTMTASPGRPWQVLLLSARTEAALATATANLAGHLQNHPDLSLADVAYTLAVGRKTFDHRRVLVCQDVDHAIQKLTNPHSPGVFTSYHQPSSPPVVFMFPGQGSQYVNMGRELYEREPIFREQIDRCAELVQPHLGIDLRQLLYHPANSEETAEQLQQTAIAQSALFIIEYALAKLWMAWGIHPEAMIGHSLGEYVAATLAGVFTLEDALVLIVHRGKLMQQMAHGAMLAVQMGELEVRSLLSTELSLAAINAPCGCVVSGTMEAINQLEQQLTTTGIACRRLHTSHAFHSPMMKPMIEAFTQHLQKITLHPPQIPFISNISGTWITLAAATDPHYWAKHLLQTVRFSQGIAELLQQPNRIFLEVGPGRTLTTFTKQYPENNVVTLTSLRHPQEQQSDIAFILNTVGRLWLEGVTINWSNFYGHEQRRHLPLPTYPFERQRYWLELVKHQLTKNDEQQTEKLDVSKWFYVPTWKQSLPLSSETKQKLSWLVFVDSCQVGKEIVNHLTAAGQDVVTVARGEQFTEIDNTYTINPQSPDDYHTLIISLQNRNLIPDQIIHCWHITPNHHLQPEGKLFDQYQYLGFYSLLFLAQALDKQVITHPLKLVAITNHVHEVTGNKKLCAEKSTILGACKVIPQEYLHITCRNIDLEISASSHQISAKLIEQLLLELTSDSSDLIVAYRGDRRWVQTFEPVEINSATNQTSKLRSQGVYLITGGLGGVGLVIAEYLAKTVQARLVLTGRTGLPDRSSWPQWLESHDQQDSTTYKIRQVQALEQLGAKVLVISADVSSEEQMRQAIAQANQHFGTIHGVIHAAGNLQKSIFQPIQTTTISQCQEHFQAKVNGLFVLAKILQNQPLDFCIFTSSLAAILGGLNFAAYAAANIFIDNFVHQQNQNHHHSWLTVNWDGWQFSPNLESSHSITPQEGQNAIAKLFHLHHLDQIIVSTTHLHPRLDKWLTRQNFKLPSTQQNNSPVKYSRPNLSNSYIQPQTELEQQIANIWQEILGIEQIGIHDNFFELGGHSLLGTQIISHLRTTLKVELPLRQLFNAPTIAEQASIIAELAQEIQKNTTQESKFKLPKIGQTTISGNIPLSYAQQRLWYLDQLQPNNIAYNIYIAVSIVGLLDIPTLQQSFNEIIRRHEILRTNFITEKGQPIQIIHPSLNLELPLIDLTNLEKTQQQETIPNLIQQEISQPFTLAQEPLLRAKILQCSSTEYIFILTQHHIISDAWSMGIFIQELITLYTAFSHKQPSPLPELSIQYANFATWQHQYLQGEVLEHLLNYWQQQLKDLPILKLPTDYTRPTIATYQGAKQSLPLHQTLLENIKNLSNREGTTIFMTLLAAFKVVLHYYSQQEDIIVGTDVANRNRAETEGIIGFFVNQLVLRTSLADNPTISQLLQRIREVTLAAYSHQDLPFDVLVSAINPDRNLTQSPLFQVKFIYDNTQTSTLDIPGLTISSIPIPKNSTQIDLLLRLTATPVGMTANLEYNTDIFAAATITRLLKIWEITVQQFVNDPNTKLQDLLNQLATAEAELKNQEKIKYQQGIQQKFKTIKRRTINTAGNRGETP
ncbi:MAG TPA: SDR family NAD(P)-dependent oxidoreductase [Nostocaceae cyanobacterium]|nr:SDR family NAD(P)-dependent oxidoreductase [Nostocaceae cyanobacterium]